MATHKNTQSFMLPFKGAPLHPHAQNLIRQGVTYRQRSYTSVDYIKDPAETDDFCAYWSQAVMRSPIAMAAYTRRTQFVGGMGFVNENLGKRPVNEEDTLHDLHLKVIQDWEMWGRLSIKVIPNRGGSPTALEHVPAEWVRYTFPEDDGEIKGVYVMPFLNTSEFQEKEAYFCPLYEPGKTNIRQDMRDMKARGQEYRGHCYFKNLIGPGHRIYGRTPMYTAQFDILADGRTGEALERITANQFMSSGALVVYGDPNEGALGKQDDMGIWEEVYKTKGELLQEQMSDYFAGTANAGNAMVLWQEPGGEAPKWVPFAHTNLHQLFTDTYSMLRERISIAAGIPQVLLGVSEPGRLGQNQQMRQAIQYTNQNTTGARRKVEIMWQKLLSDFRGFNTRGGVEIKPLQDFSDLPDTVFNSLTAKQKDKYLQEAFGIEPDPEGRQQATPFAAPEQESPAQPEQSQQPDNNQDDANEID